MSMQHKYGYYSPAQIHETKLKLQKQIFYLLLIVDPKTRNTEYNKSEIENVITTFLYKLGGMNSIFNEPPELCGVMSALEGAKLILDPDGYIEQEFRSSDYRKLILDAGSEIMKIKEV